LLPKLDVEGSNPFARFRKTLQRRRLRFDLMPVGNTDVGWFSGSSVVVPSNAETAQSLS